MSNHLSVPSSRGVTVALHDLGGPGAGAEPLIICHATGMHGPMYAPLAAAGLTRRFHVWALDFRGHGASTAPDDGDFAWEGMADDLVACLGAIGVAQAHVVGHSMGGGSILLAEQRAPGTVLGAYLYEPIVMSQDYLALRAGDNPMSAAARRRREVFASREEVLARYASRPPLNVLRADALWRYVEHGFVDLPDGTVQLACRAESEARTFEGSRSVLLENCVGITAPVVVGRGDAEEGPGPAMMAAPLAETLPNARLVTYPHLGHFGPFEAPHQIASDILAAFP